MKKTELQKMKKAELLELAEKKRIKVSSSMLKSEIVDILHGKLKPSGKTAGLRGAGAAKRKKRKVKPPRAKAKKTPAAGKRPSSSRVEKTGGDSARRERAPGEMERPVDERTIRQKAVAGKYYLTKESEQIFLKTEASDLPRYSETRIVGMVRDPRCLFTYWEVSPEDHAGLEESFGSEWSDCRMILRVYEISESGATEGFFDIELSEGAENWYIEVSPRKRYRIGIGAISPDGRFVEIALSEEIHTPREDISQQSEARWKIPETRSRKILKASGEYRRSSASGELSAERSRSKGESETVSSFSEGPGAETEEGEDFVRAELVVYGSAGRDCRITLLGREIKTGSDGTFSIRMELPEGEVELPVKLVSPRGEWEKKIKAVIDTEKP